MLWWNSANDRFEEKAEDGELSRDGKPGGGLETIYAGGMHNLAIDEAGKVCLFTWGYTDKRSDLGESTIMLPLDESLPMYLIPTTLGRSFLVRTSRRIRTSLMLLRRKDSGLSKLLLGIVSVWP
jgi:hypothetical protein